MLLAPAFFLICAGFLLPLVQILSYGVVTSDGDEFTLAHFRRYLQDAYYLGILGRTLRLSLLITALCIFLGVPLAYIISRVSPRLRFVLLVVTILPLLTSVVIRTFGWVVLFARGGPVSKLAYELGLAERNFAFLYTETGIVIAMVQVLLPFAAITVLGSFNAIDPRLEEAARTMGCGFWETMRRVVAPLALPGIISGSLLVFALSISSFVTPAVIGGARLPMLAVSIYKDAVGTLDWGFAAAQSTILLFAVMVVVLPYMQLARVHRG